jgi:hypothetical protein
VRAGTAVHPTGQSQSGRWGWQGPVAGAKPEPSKMRPLGQSLGLLPRGCAEQRPERLATQQLAPPEPSPEPLLEPLPEPSPEPSGEARSPTAVPSSEQAPMRIAPKQMSVR